MCFLNCYLPNFSSHSLPTDYSCYIIFLYVTKFFCPAVNLPGAFIWTGGSRKSEPSRLSDRCLSSVDGRSLILSDIWRLNGEAWFNCWNPRNEPWRCSIDTVACGLSMAYGLNTGFMGGASETNRHELLS